MMNSTANPELVMENKTNNSILKQSSHPGSLVAHYLFRTIAIVIYLLGGWFSISYIGMFVTIIILLALDFWTGIIHTDFFDF